MRTKTMLLAAGLLVLGTSAPVWAQSSAGGSSASGNTSSSASISTSGGASVGVVQGAVAEGSRASGSSSADTGPAGGGTASAAGVSPAAQAEPRLIDGGVVNEAVALGVTPTGEEAPPALPTASGGPVSVWALLGVALGLGVLAVVLGRRVTRHSA